MAAGAGVNQNETFSKRSLYKPASPLQKTSFLQQGKLVMSTDSYSDVKSRPKKAVSLICSSTSHPTPERFNSTTMYPARGHTHSLSPSDSDDSSLLQSETSEEKLPTNTSFVESDRKNQVLLMDASAGIVASSGSTALKVASVKVPSRVKIVPHFRKDDSQWRRFSSNFVSHEPSVQTPQVDLHHNEDFDVTLHANEAHLTDPETIKTVPPIMEETSHNQDVPDNSKSYEDASSTVLGRKPETSGSFPKSVDVHEISTVKKKKKGRVIPSRYMSGTGNSSKKQQPATRHSSTTVHLVPTPGASKSRVLKSSQKHQVKPAPLVEGFKVPTAVPRSRSRLNTPRSLDSSLPPALQQDDFFSTPVLHHQGITTSTPFHHREGPSIHDGSFVSDFSRAPSAIKGSSKRKMQYKTLEEENCVDEFEMELLYNRLVQITYLDIMSAKALKQQEAEAKAEIYKLWQIVEDKKEEVSRLTKEAETQQRNLAVDKALDVQADGLKSVCTELPLLEKQYGKMAQALDTTRHDMVFEGVLPVDKDEIATELAETEVSLGEVNAIIREKIPKVSNFSSCVDAITTVLNREYQELDRCWEDLTKVIRTQSKETSLQFEKKYRIPNNA